MSEDLGSTHHHAFDPFEGYCPVPASGWTEVGCLSSRGPAPQEQMLKMQPTWQDKLSPSGGLLNYQWNDQLLQMELDEMNLLTEAQQARNFPSAPASSHHGSACRLQ